MRVAFVSFHNILLVIAFILAILAVLPMPSSPKGGWFAWSWVFFIASLLFNLPL